MSADMLGSVAVGYGSTVPVYPVVDGGPDFSTWGVLDRAVFGGYVFELVSLVRSHDGDLAVVARVDGVVFRLDLVYAHLGLHSSGVGVQCNALERCVVESSNDTWSAYGTDHKFGVVEFWRDRKNGDALTPVWDGLAEWVAQVRVGLGVSEYDSILYAGSLSVSLAEFWGWVAGLPNVPVDEIVDPLWPTTDCGGSGSRGYVGGKQCFPFFDSDLRLVQLSQGRTGGFEPLRFHLDDEDGLVCAADMGGRKLRELSPVVLRQLWVESLLLERLVVAHEAVESGGSA